MSRFFPLVLLASLSAFSSGVVSTFANDDEGWLTANFDFATSTASLDVDPLDYSPHGYVSTQDVDVWCFFAAPSKFLGDQSTAFGTDLTFDAYVTEDDAQAYPSVVLQGRGKTIFNVGNAPGAAWTAVSIPLVGSSWTTKLDGTGPAVTDDELKSVLGSLTGLFVEADWTATSLTETTGLDNVRLQSVPEPAPLAALALGMATLLRRRWGNGAGA